MDKTAKLVIARIILVDLLLIGFAAWMSMPKTEIIEAKVVKAAETQQAKPRRPTKVAQRDVCAQKTHELDKRGGSLHEPLAMDSRDPAKRQVLHATTAPFIPPAPHFGTSVPRF
ncbi:hypothetical protein JW752_01960 [Candidatus Peregrinibacteria bacterium]|nr:hypothetical protein [Candidatus Peregrinibacteria bacterium]